MSRYTGISDKRIVGIIHFIIDHDSIEVTRGRPGESEGV